MFSGYIRWQIMLKKRMTFDGVHSQNITENSLSVQFSRPD